MFLVTEVLFFGGLFPAYAVYRETYRAAFEGASNLLDLTLGTTNTVVLIVSSLTMALAVWAASRAARTSSSLFLVLTMVLGTAFLGIKCVEYKQKFEHHEVPGPHFVVPLNEETHQPLPRQSEMFFSLYFCMTGLHAAHMIIGLGLLTWLLVKTRKNEFSARVQHAGRARRAVLALRRHRLDLPVPAALPAREAHAVSAAREGSLVARRLLRRLRRPAGLHRPHRLRRADPAPRHLEHAGRARHRGDEGHARGAHLHAPALLAEADGARRRLGRALSGDPVVRHRVRLLHATWLPIYGAERSVDARSSGAEPPRGQAAPYEPRSADRRGLRGSAGTAASSTPTQDQRAAAEDPRRERLAEHEAAEHDRDDRVDDRDRADHRDRHAAQQPEEADERQRRADDREVERRRRSPTASSAPARRARTRRPRGAAPSEPASVCPQTLRNGETRGRCFLLMTFA